MPSKLVGMMCGEHPENGVIGNFDSPQIKLAQKWCWLQWNAGTECNIMLPLAAFPKNY